MDYEKYRNQKNGDNNFKKDLFEEYGVSNNPKAEQCYNIAYEFGHSDGYYEIAHYFSDIVELIK